MPAARVRGARRPSGDRAAADPSAGAAADVAAATTTTTTTTAAGGGGGGGGDGAPEAPAHGSQVEPLQPPFQRDGPGGADRRRRRGRGTTRRRPVTQKGALALALKPFDPPLRASPKRFCCDRLRKARPCSLSKASKPPRASSR
jgi:hypothetical protein